MTKSGPTLHMHANATEVVKNADDSLTISFDNEETITVDCLIWLSDVQRILLALVLKRQALS